MKLDAPDLYNMLFNHMLVLLINAIWGGYWFANPGKLEPNKKVFMLYFFITTILMTIYTHCNYYKLKSDETTAFFKGHADI